MLRGNPVCGFLGINLPWMGHLAKQTIGHNCPGLCASGALQGFIFFNLFSYIFRAS
eukprot:m.59189 g.59189  ORF g.59189 m.59189 type:complete len:56 (-) comp7901_c0_seq1:2250-2417(-)